MKCPVCKTTALAPHALEAGLPSHRCPACGGQWVESARYWKWLEAFGGTPPPPDPTALAADGGGGGGDEDPVVHESVRAKLCPECGRLLTRAKVGKGVDFSLERCGHCGGIWLDDREWEVLRRHGLHHNVHFVFSAAWQAEVARRQREAEHARLLLAKLGAADLAEVRRVRAWLDAHPHRAELYAVLLDGAEGVLPPRPRGR